MSTTIPRVIEQRPDDDERPGLGAWLRERLPRHAARGALAGAEAAILSWAVLAIPAIAAYVATASSPELGQAGWLEAARVGTGLWVLGHGGSLTAGGVTFTLYPLGVTLVSLLLMAGAIRRARLDSWPPLGFAAAVYAAFAAAFVAFSDGGAGWVAVLGAVMVGGLGALLGMRGRLPAPPARIARVTGSEWVRLGARTGLVTLGVLYGLGLLAVLISVIGGFGVVRGLQEAYQADAVGNIVFTLAQLLLVPTLAVWGSAVLLGPGFALGTGTSFAPGHVVAGPVPPIPVLGALPDADGVVATLPVLGYLGLLVGALIGLRLAMRGRRLPLAQALGATGLTLALAVAVTAVLAGMSGGAVGPGRLAEAGTAVGPVTLAVAWQLAAVTVPLVIAAHPSTHAWVRGLIARVPQRAGG